MPEQPCWPECKEMLLRQVESEVRRLETEIKRIEAILAERKDSSNKAAELLARDAIRTETSGIMDKYVLREYYEKQINNLQGQLTGEFGFEPRMRSLEDSRGIIDAKIYMIIIGVPVAVSAAITYFLK